ncbi:MAG: AraC family transcriptional regulator [Lachnospiraceae bacterium]|nr:AraC family transcriptional regulator [Candidatus Hippenecus merdae]
MDHSQIIETCIENIEAHLKEELTVQSLSQKAGFSPYYFCRVFEVYTGLPVMEYVRRRRLAHAETELWEGRRITDIAADYGFDTHSGFSKAFKKIYGYSPSEYCQRTSLHRPPMPNPLSCLKEADFPEAPVCRIEQRQGFYVAGKILRTARDLSSVSCLPALWQHYTVYDVDSVIYAAAKPKEHGEYNICFPVGDGLYRHVNAVKIDTTEGLEGNLYMDYVPAALCAVFSTPPVFSGLDEFITVIKDTWKYIYNDWLPASGYEPDPMGRDYEFYDARAHGTGPFSMDICIPIKRKNE